MVGGSRTRAQPAHGHLAGIRECSPVEAVGQALVSIGSCGYGQAALHPSHERRRGGPLVDGDRGHSDGNESLPECGQRGMLGHLDLVLGEEGRAVEAEELGVGEVDMPFDRRTYAGRRRRGRIGRSLRWRVVEEAVPDLHERAGDGQVALLRERHLRPARVLDRAVVNGVARARHRVEDLLVWVLHERRIARQQIAGLVASPLEWLWVSGRRRDPRPIAAFIARIHRCACCSTMMAVWARD